ncbi:MAG: hypothetical protein D6729_02020 [Deltaproteobacteria bacterium]|nr:MAG: hypothetical protein D6729_02020 [Deltaproteobacteria bacterium]
MKAVKLLMVALFTLAATTGCIIKTTSNGGGSGVGGGGGGGGGLSTGDLTVLYLFGGARCDVAGVTEIRVNVVGVDVADSDTKTVRCADFPEGITIKGFTPGSYDVEVSGTVDGRPLYAMDAPLRVEVRSNADNSYDVNVPAVAGDLAVYWDFGGKDCSAAGVSEVRAILYDPSNELLGDARYPCDAGGVEWTLVQPGTYTVLLQALSDFGEVTWAAEATLMATAGAANDYTVTLEHVAGNLTLYWTFEGSGVCGAVAEVRVQLSDASGRTVDDSRYDCSFGGVTYDELPEGSYTATLEGLDGAGLILYRAAGVTTTVIRDRTSEYTIDLRATN